MAAAKRAGRDEETPPKKRRVWLIPAAIGAVVLATLAVGFFVLPSLGLFQSKRAELLTHTVVAETLPVSVVERGTLESSDNREVVCKVKAGARGTFASSIKWVIDDGTMVTKGQPVMDLDDSALRDQEQQQNITLAKAHTAYIKAKEEYDIQLKVNASDIAQKRAALEVAELDLEKFLGVRTDEDLNPRGAILGAPFSLVEKGEYRMKLDDVSSQLKNAESDLEAYRDRSAWADRSSRSGYLTPSQAKVERSRLEGALDKLEKVQKEKFALENYTRRRELTDLSSKVKVASAGYEQSILQAHAKQVQAESETGTAFSVYQQEIDKLDELRVQLSACKISSPQNGMVVYYKDPNGRFGGGTQALIQVGEQVKEGQKLLRIPDLSRMQVNAKIHEALVTRIRGDDRRPTGIYEAMRAGMLANPHAFSRLTFQSDWAVDQVHDNVRSQEYYTARQGQLATIRVDAMSSRTFQGRVRSVAAVASQADWSSSDVKLFPTIVSIDDTDVAGLKPDMSAEVNIQVEASEIKVLTVPIQAVVGRADMGSKRKVYVLEGGQTTERDIELGSFNDKKVEVKSGLNEGDVVVLNPKAILGEKAAGIREEGDPSGRGNGKSGGMPGGGGTPKGGAPGGAPKGGAPGGGGKGGGKPTV